jgi:hypothetical protein
MLVILPSGEQFAVPAEVETVKGLKASLEAVYGIPQIDQRLFVGATELHEKYSLDLVRGDARIDLIIAVGKRYAICREALRDQFNHLADEVLVTNRSIIASRNLDVLDAKPAIDVANWSRKAIDKERVAALEKITGPYFIAFEKNKVARLEKLRRTREKLDPGLVVISTFNGGYCHMIENWAASCDRHAIDCRAFTLLFPTDARADVFARNLGFQTYFDGESYGDIPKEAHVKFGDATFRKFLFAKLATTQDMLAIGADIIRQDVDIVWLRDPRRDLAGRMDRDELDFLFMFDGPNRHYQPLHYNSGFVAVRNNPFARKAWQLVFSNFARVFENGGEQRLINLVMNCMRERGLRTARLPEDVFVNGHVISRALRQGGALPDTGVVVHASWTTNVDVKVEHLMKYGLWYLPNAGYVPSSARTPKVGT